MDSWLQQARLPLSLPVELQHCPVRGVALDSRQVQPGDVFLAVGGASQHGLAHVEQARQRGAVAVLSDRAPANDISLPWAAVPDLAAHAGTLADLAYGRPSQQLQVLGVTGTNGKTSTVQFLGQALTHLGRTPATQGTLGSGFAGALQAAERTTPDATVTQRWLAQMHAAGADVVAMEVSSHALVQGRVDAVRFTGALFTNLSRDHLDYHRDMEDYFAAKARLFAWPALHFAVINQDDAWGRRLSTMLPPSLRAIGYAIDAPADLSATQVHCGSDGIALTLSYQDQSLPLQLALLGRFNLSNVLGVAGALLAMGHAFPQVVEALAALQPVPGRMQRIDGPRGSLIVVDYAHTPDALTQALSSLRAHTRGRLIVLFGCGGERDRGKRPLMAQAAEAAADHIVVTDDNPRGEDGDAIVAEICGGFSAQAPMRVQRDRAAAIAEAIEAAADGDVVLIAGKGHEPYQEIAGTRWPFDDAEIARRCAGAVAC
ncbi:MAG: UDP-N-acetylmuramoyl-L-alanyl-D-glutamate--2,6-diaminopimelate ligase [Xanthomonadales bacterium]|nr:UDP-N-acetylmuramoyl-L-alanyl-D-glutamate--2,6-diaminopimelate ligase [Xanthomonadales bacterium]